MKLIEKVAKAIFESTLSTKGTYRAAEIPNKLCSKINIRRANAAIKALPIVLLPEDAEPEEGDDILIKIECDIRGTQEIIIRASDIQNYDGEFIKIIRRNGISAIYDEEK